MPEDRPSFKKRIKLVAKNNAFRFAHKLAIRRIKKIARNSSPSKVKKDGKKILVNLIYGMYGRLIFWEGGLAKAMQVRGHDVKALICGKTLTMCTSEYTVQSVHDDKTCKHCVDFSQDFLKNAGIPYLNFRSYLSEEDVNEIKSKINKLTLDKCKNLVYKDINVGGLSKNAALRYFEGSINPDEKLYESVLRSELINSIIATDIAEKIFNTEKPDVLVTTHMGYSSWGAIVEYFSKNGVRICYPGEGYIENTIEFDFDIPGKPKEFFKKYFEGHRKNKLLTKKEDEDLQRFVDNRIHGKEGDTSIYQYSTDDAKSLFNLDKYEKTYACFPNVAWDSSLLNADKGFTDVYEWVSHTVKLFKDKPNYQLIVKIHPSEAYVAKSKNTVSDYIKDNFSPLPENIKIIPPVTKISPYSLFSFIDAGLVYNGTIGLEMSLHGIPVIVSGITHYGDKGFTLDVSTKEEYDELIFSELNRLPKQKIQMARVYAYFYFLKSFVPYNIANKKKFLKIKWNIESFDDLDQGKNKFLDIICDYIANDEIYQDW